MTDPVEVLHDVIARAFLNPFSTQEWDEVRAELAGREAEVERLGEILAKERADVDWVNHPLNRVVLWLYGELHTRRAKETEEYEAARSDVLRQGVPAQELRMWLERLQPDVAIGNDEIYDALDHVQPKDLRSLPLDLNELYARVRRHRVCASAAARLRIDIDRVPRDPKLLGMLSRELEAVGERTLAERLTTPGVNRGVLLEELQGVKRPAGLDTHLRALAKRALFERS